MGNYIHIIFFVIVHVLTCDFVDGRLATQTTRTNKSILKTIESENGEIIDCFDIYKQPAFDHPMLHNHTIQMKPSAYPRRTTRDHTFEFEIKQTWHKYGNCPERTIPVIRTRNNTLSAPTLSENEKTVEYAVVVMTGQKFNGAEGRFNVQIPLVDVESESSSSQIWVRTEDNSNFVTAGWILSPTLYPEEERHQRLFVYWTNDNSKTTGCYNLLCPGFVHVHKTIPVGAILDPASWYGGAQYDVVIAIFKDENRGDWWVKLNNEYIGYWPKDIFTKLAEGATAIQMGGKVINSWPGGFHTKTQMGNGAFPSEGYGRSTYISNIEIIDENSTFRKPDKMVTYFNNQQCYYSQIAEDKESSLGTYFLFGGPGMVSDCRTE
ncbi:hypothetical protein MKX01_000894 [Papaver californicum]|nr:hypothetical protein MKX01_000894 [Papaver californicum]